MRGLDGKAVAITGAGSGLGRALAVQAAARGARLALSDWAEEGLVETARLAESAALVPGTPVRTDLLDVRDRSAMRAYADAVATGLGGVDAVVNNAGVALFGDLTEVGYEDFERVIDVDLWGVVQGTKEFLPHLIASGDGAVVNLSSLFGLLGVPGQTAYCAAKFAVRGFSEALRTEMLRAGHPVAVTCVHPGGVRTGIARHARTTTSHDPADLARHFDTRLARTTAERAAEVTWSGVLAERARVVVGTDAVSTDRLVRLVGPRYQRAVASLSRRLGP